MRRWHTAAVNGRSTIRPVVIVPVAIANNKARNGREVYLSNKKPVDLYNFDSDYLVRLQARDAEIQAHFAGYFSRLLTIRLRVLGISGSALDDIRQETLFRVLREVRAGNVKSPDRFGPYVYAVCNHVVSEWKRAQWPNWNGSDEMPDVLDPSALPEEPVRLEEIRKTVHWVLERVPRKDRRILIAVFIDERDKEEICQEFNVSREYLRVLLHRALLNARKKLGKGPDQLEKGIL